MWITCIKLYDIADSLAKSSTRNDYIEYDIDATSERVNEITKEKNKNEWKCRIKE